MRIDPRPLWLGVALLACGCGAEARAYPQYVGKGYTSCGSCHYSPTGGGMANSYGHMAVAATFPDEVSADALDQVRDLLAKPDITGRGDGGQAEFQIDAGVDTRVLLLRHPGNTDDDLDVVVIPMLLEVGGVAAYGSGFAYASFTARPSTEAGGDRTMAPFSREHWIGYRLSDAQSLRLGRIVLPFGLRLADHAQPTRASFGFDKYDQHYAVAWDWATEGSVLSVAAFAGKQLGAWDEQGAVASYTHLFPSRLALGASLLGADAIGSTRVAASLFARWRVWEASYVLAEVAGQRRAAKGTDAEVLEAASFLRVGIFPMESVDVYAQVGGRTMHEAYETTKLRYLVGADWKVLPWVELPPAYLFEEDVETGPRHGALAQFHVYW